MSKQVICMRTDLGMSRGKIAAQAAHSSMMFLIERIKKTNFDLVHSFTDEETDWLFNGGMTKIVVAVNSLEQMQAIYDKAGKTVPRAMITDKTLRVPTCIALGPADEGVLNKLVGSLPLLRDESEKDKAAEG